MTRARLPGRGAGKHALGAHIRPRRTGTEAPEGAKCHHFVDSGRNATFHQCRNSRFSGGLRDPVRIFRFFPILTAVLHFRDIHRLSFGCVEGRRRAQESGTRHPSHARRSLAPASCSPPETPTEFGPGGCVTKRGGCTVAWSTSFGSTRRALLVGGAGTLRRAGPIGSVVLPASRGGRDIMEPDISNPAMAANRGGSCGRVRSFNARYASAAGLFFVAARMSGIRRFSRPPAASTGSRSSAVDPARPVEVRVVRHTPIRQALRDK